MSSTPQPHRYDFRTLKRACILLTLPGRGQTIEQEDKGCESPQLRKAIKAAWRAYERVMKESK